MAGSKGFGAVWKIHWCCVEWPKSWVRSQVAKNVVLLELFLILIALELWGAEFTNRRILVVTDNRGVMFAVNCFSSGSLLVIKILRQIVFCV